MHIHRVAAVSMLLSVASLASAQSPAGQPVQKVSTSRSVYVWKAGPPTDSATQLRRWRIEGAAGSSTDATKIALGKINAAALRMFGDTMDVLAELLTSSVPIAPGFSPWGVVPQKKEDLLLLEKGQIEPQSTPVLAPARFEPGKNGGWQIKIDGVPWFFAALVYPAKDGSGLIVDGPFAVLTPTAGTAVLSTNTVPAIVVGRIRYPEDRWSSIGGGYTIKGGGLEFDATGVSLMVGTQYTFDAAAAAALAAPAPAAPAAPPASATPAPAPSAAASPVATNPPTAKAPSAPSDSARTLCFPTGRGGVLSLEFSADGAFISDGSVLCALGEGANPGALDTAVPASGRRIALAPDGKSILVRSSVYDDPVTLSIYALPSLALVKHVTGIDVSRSDVRWMPDGEHIVVEHYATMVSPESSLSIWSLATGQQTWTAKTTAPLRAISPDGKTLACADSVPDAAADRRSYRVELIPVDDASRRKTFVAHSSWVQQVRFSPDSKTLATAGGDNQVKVWSVADGALLQTLAGHGDAVFDLTFTRDGKTLVSVSTDKTMRFWDPANGRSLGMASIGGPGITAMALSPDERAVAIAETGGTVMLYNFEQIRARAETPAARPAAAPAAPPPPVQPPSEPAGPFQLPAELARLKVPSGKKFVIAQKDVSVEPTGRVQITLSLTGAKSPRDAASITSMEVFYVTKHANLKSTDKDDVTGPVGMRHVRDGVVANLQAFVRRETPPTVPVGMWVDLSDRTGWPVGGFSGFHIQRASEAEVVAVGIINPHPHTTSVMDSHFFATDGRAYDPSDSTLRTFQTLHPTLEDLAPRALGVVLYDQKGPVSNLLWVTLPK